MFDPWREIERLTPPMQSAAIQTPMVGCTECREKEAKGLLIFACDECGFRRGYFFKCSTPECNGEVWQPRNPDTPACCRCRRLMERI